MTQAPFASRADRLKTAAEARKAQAAKFTPRPGATDPRFAERAAIKAAELARVREARAEARTAKRQAAADAELQARGAQEALDAAELQNRRDQRKERKVLTKAEAKAKRDARYAARKARR